MPLRSILAAFSGDPASCSALDFALKLQRRHGAHVTGMLWHGPIPLESRHRAFLSRGTATMLSGREDEAALKAKADFEARVAAAGDPAAASFVDLHEMETVSLPVRARAHDLVVMTRHAAEVGREHAEVRPDVVALRSGRPVITVPDDHAGGVPGHVAVAWDGKRAATRALGDLVQLLGGVERVTLVTVGGAPGSGAAEVVDVMALLERHGFDVAREHRQAGRRIDRVLLETAGAVGADMLVMGAYEHSKFSEDLWGGVTRDILTEAKLPVMMSH